MEGRESLLVPRVWVDALVLDEEGDDGQVAFERRLVKGGLSER